MVTGFGIFYILLGLISLNLSVDRPLSVLTVLVGIILLMYNKD